MRQKDMFPFFFQVWARMKGCFSFIKFRKRHVTNEGRAGIVCRIYLEAMSLCSVNIETGYDGS